MIQRINGYSSQWNADVGKLGSLDSSLIALQSLRWSVLLKREVIMSWEMINYIILLIDFKDAISMVALVTQGE